MNFTQSLRRLGQQVSGWQKSLDRQDAQFRILKKLYTNNGLELNMTCSACPEQYEVFKDGKQVAYYRLRHGHFRVDYPNCGSVTIYEDSPNGDGIFDDSERLVYLAKAMRSLLNKLNEK